MSNSEQSKKPMKSLAQIIESMSTNIKENNNKDTDVKREDFNVLPIPLTQEIFKKPFGSWIEWTWEPGGLNIKIIGILATQDINWDERKVSQGDYEIHLHLPENSPGDFISDSKGVYTFQFQPDIAKAIGQSLISAWNWKDIWKEHAGTFLERELFGYEEE